MNEGFVLMMERRSPEMKPYNPNVECPKCGSESVGTRYSFGHLVRECRRCGFSWNENAVDAQEAEGKEDTER